MSIKSSIKAKNNFKMKNIKKNSMLLGIVCVYLFIPFQASGQQALIFQETNNGYEGTYGTFFQTADPYAFNGFSDEWEWDGEDNAGVNYMCLRFENIVGSKSGQIPPNSVVIRAVLQLYVTDPGDSASVHELLIPFNDESDLIDFGDGIRPRSGIDYKAAAVANAPSSNAAGETIEVDLTESLKKIVSGEEFLGWIFIPSGSGGHGFASAWADANQPKLIVIIEGEPTTQGIRSISKKIANIGDAIDISIKLSLESGVQDVKMQEILPRGWSASGISDGGALDSGIITWNINNFSGTKTLTYKAQITTDTSMIPIFKGTVNELFEIAGDNKLQVLVPLYETGNVLAVGVWNDSSSSSDLVVTAELSDNNGTVYVRDSGAPEGWPAGTIFRWITVWDGFLGEEQPGWQQREFNDSSWTEETSIGFTVGQGGSNENGEITLTEFDETVYTRSIFNVKNINSIYKMTLKIEGDDSAVAWLNGVYIGYDGANAGDNGESPQEYVYSTTTGGRSGDISGEASTDYVPGTIYTIMIKPEPMKLSRIFPEPAFTPGKTIEGIQVAVAIPEGQTPNVTVTETPPAGWNVGNIKSSRGDAKLENGNILWTIPNAAGSITLTYAITPPSDAASGNWSGSGNDGTYNVAISGVNVLNPYRGPVPLYKEENVLAIGVWNADNTSSDLVVTAELSDNNGNVYVRDSGAAGGWPKGTIFRWKTVFFADGSGEEEPDWQQRGFDDGAWTEQKDLGFTLGHGSGGENGETLIDANQETVYTRSIFNPAAYESIIILTLKLEGDDTAVAWINGVYVGYDGGSTGDNGEAPSDLVFNSTTNGRSSDVSGEIATDYDPGTIMYLLVDLVESTPVYEWFLY